MTFPRLTSAQYDEILEELSWKPATRLAFETERELARKLEERLAKMDEETRRYNQVTAWQGEALRAIYALYALRFDIETCEARNRGAAWLNKARERRRIGARGFWKRMQRARQEAADGCELQAKWLADHAGIIEALEAQLRQQ
jgi:hypothetical protein